jgi:hypothetical protein
MARIEFFPDGYERSRKKVPRTQVAVRPITLDEIKSLQSGERVDFVSDSDGHLRTLTINGAVKRWVRSPDRVRVSVKYGLYEHARFEAADALVTFKVRLTPDEIKQG